MTNDAMTNEYPKPDEELLKWSFGVSYGRAVLRFEMSYDRLCRKSSIFPPAPTTLILLPSTNPQSRRSMRSDCQLHLVGLSTPRGSASIPGICGGSSKKLIGLDWRDRKWRVLDIWCLRSRLPSA